VPFGIFLGSSGARTGESRHLARPPRPRCHNRPHQVLHALTWLATWHTGCVMPSLRSKRLRRIDAGGRHRAGQEDDREHGNSRQPERRWVERSDAEQHRLDRDRKAAGRDQADSEARCCEPEAVAQDDRRSVESLVPTKSPSAECSVVSI
jgi:hypothetical protein